MTNQIQPENKNATLTNSTSESGHSPSKTEDSKGDRQAKSLTLFNSRWLAYATAGIATGFSLAAEVEAEIRYSGLVNIKMEGSQSTTLPLKGGASLHFAIGSFADIYPSGAFWITGAKSASARVYQPSSRFHILADIKHGSPISSGPFSSVLISNQMFAWIQSFYGRGYFGTHGGGFIGFRFNIGRGAQYGWARIKVQGPTPFVLNYLIRDYAWADSGDPIVAGQTHRLDEKVSAIPRPGSLGLLAVGAPGLDAWRSSRRNRPAEN